MSATAKTLGSLGIALVGLLVYVAIFLGTAVFKIGAFGLALYLGLGLTAVLFAVIITFTTVGGADQI